MESKSSTMSRLNSSNFLAMRVDLLDIKEQQKIAAFLFAQDKKITLTRQQLDKTKQF